jgi:hypothetical protein
LRRTKAPEIDPPLVIECDDLAIQDDVQLRQLGAEPAAELIEPAEGITPLGVDGTAAAGQIADEGQLSESGKEVDARG